MQENAAAVSFQSVSKVFAGNEALRDITLDLPRNAVTAIVGESGSGKSTLLEHINGLHRPDRGIVSVLGEPIDYSALTGLRHRIGYAVQRVGLFPHLRAGENISLTAQLLDWESGQITARRCALMRLFELDPALADRYPHELSGGQQQRVGLCRAMMLQPELLLLDEPFSGADPITRTGIHREFQAWLAHEPTTVVLVTHDLREARRLADRLVIVREGRLLQSGNTTEVIGSPADDYVAKLMREHLS